MPKVEIRCKIDADLRKKLIAMADKERRCYGQQLEIIIEEAYQQFLDRTKDADFAVDNIDNSK